VLQILKQSQQTKETFVSFFFVESKKVRFGIPSKKGLKKGREIKVIFTAGCCLAKARKIGTVMATSPIAESLMTAICLIFFDKFMVVKEIISYFDTKQDSTHHRCTFSFVCTLS
jgi:hypothetical protein